MSDVPAASYAVASEYQVDGEGAAAKLLAARPDLDRRYINRVRLGGIKLWLDGSIPTAWFSEAYAHNPPGKDGDYRGFPQVTDDYVNGVLERFWKTGLQINMHMNGDAAAEQALQAVERAERLQGPADARPVFIHATYMRPDQIARMKRLGAIPTFTAGSLIAAGDAAVHYWGEDRAAASMPMNTLERMGVPFSLNHDAPI
ncbi:amidohydrolase family protein, partial [Nostoc sp. NIES-2111]